MINENKTNIKLNIPTSNWWEDEVFNLDNEKLEEFKDINYVITHTITDFCDPTNDFGNWSNFVSGFFEDDPTLENMLIKERRNVTTAYNILRKNNNIKYWYYGHFHKSHEHINNNTKFICLNIGEMKEIL